MKYIVETDIGSLLKIYNIAQNQKKLQEDTNNLLVPNQITAVKLYDGC